MEVSLTDVTFVGDKIERPSYIGGYYQSVLLGEGNEGVLSVTESGTNTYSVLFGEDTIGTDCWGNESLSNE